MPVGYARTEQGAVAAAAQYVTAFDGVRGVIEEERAAVLDVIAADDARERLAEAMRPGSDMVVETYGLTPEVVRDPGFVARTVPAGYELVDYSDDQAVVRVWGTAMFFAEGREALSGSWSTDRLTLRWERGDWRLVSRDSAQGPAPPDTPTPALPGAGERINAFEKFVYVPPPT